MIYRKNANILKKKSQYLKRTQGDKNTRGQEDERTRRNKRGRIVLNSPTQHYALKNASAQL